MAGASDTENGSINRENQHRSPLRPALKKRVEKMLSDMMRAEQGPCPIGAPYARRRKLHETAQQSSDQCAELHRSREINVFAAVLGRLPPVDHGAHNGPVNVTEN